MSLTHTTVRRPAPVPAPAVAGRPPQVDPAVAAAGLVKRFGDVAATDGGDLTVRTGEVFGVLGPNGAGKTTMLRMLTTLLPIDGGRARPTPDPPERCATAEPAVTIGAGPPGSSAVRPHRRARQRFARTASGMPSR